MFRRTGTVVALAAVLGLALTAVMSVSLSLARGATKHGRHTKTTPARMRRFA